MRANILLTKCVTCSPSSNDRVTEGKLAPLRYVDDANEATEVYPFNPNGSVDGIAALCSPGECVLTVPFLH